MVEPRGLNFYYGELNFFFLFRIPAEQMFQFNNSFRCETPNIYYTVAAIPQLNHFLLLQYRFHHCEAPSFILRLARCW
jgi:hypothetical protein